jgi:hypothetical protein
VTTASNVTSCGDDPPMTDYSPFVGSNPPPSQLKLVRTLWTMTKPGKKPITAAIYQSAAGRELRVHLGVDVDNVIESLLSRTDGATDVQGRRTAGGAARAEMDAVRAASVIGSRPTAIGSTVKTERNWCSSPHSGRSRRTPRGRARDSGPGGASDVMGKLIRESSYVGDFSISHFVTSFGGASGLCFS